MTSCCPTPIPDKGKILTQLSLWWFDQLADVVPNHVISGTDVPPEWAGRAIRCRRLDMLPVECIARGYLAGLGLDSYRTDGTVSGIAAAAGAGRGLQAAGADLHADHQGDCGARRVPDLRRGRLPRSAHDTADELRRITLEVYRRGAALAAERGVIIADTKLEFGRAPDGTLVLADEVLTSDSSRFWAAEEWQPGGPQRTWTSSSSGTGQPPSPAGIARRPGRRSRRRS